MSTGRKEREPERVKLKEKDRKKLRGREKIVWP